VFLSKGARIWYHDKISRSLILTVAQSQSRGLVETLSTGYVHVNQRLWVLAIPVVLDVYLWLGAQLSFAPLFRVFRDRITALDASSLEPQQQERLFVQLQNTDMRGALAWLNWVPLALPDLFGPGSAATGNVIYVSNGLTMLAAVLSINLLLLLVSSLFLTLLAAGVRGEPCPWSCLLRRTGGAVLGIGVYALIVLGVGVITVLPLLIVVLGIAQFAPGVVSFIAIGLFIIGFWVYTFLGFVVETMLIGDVGPLRAIVLSVHMVRHSLFGALGLILLTLVIIYGMGVVWGMLATTWWGVMLAIVGNAYIGSGLIAARMIFCRDRLAAVQHPARAV
jgi:hypothetical protein